MRSVELRELKKVNPKRPVLLAGFPGLGYVGKLSITYMVTVLKAEKFAEFYSPYFPHHVLSDENSLVRLLRLELYYWKNLDETGRDLILLTGDAQLQSVEGQYLVSSEILSYVRGKGVDMVITIGGYQSQPKGSPAVIGASTNRSLLESLRKAGARVRGRGNPIVGLAGVLIGLAGFYGMTGVCLLGETPGYIVDVKTTREVLKVLSRLLGLDMPLEKINRDILKEVGETISEVEAEMRGLERVLSRMMDKKITYIS